MIKEFEKTIQEYNLERKSNLCESIGIERFYIVWKELLKTSDNVIIFEKDLSDKVFGIKYLYNDLIDYFEKGKTQLNVILYDCEYENDTVKLIKEYAELYPKQIEICSIHNLKRNKHLFSKNNNKEFNFIVGDSERYVFGHDFYNDYRSDSSFNRKELCCVFEKIFNDYLSL